jgi:hypothetical protein
LESMPRCFKRELAVILKLISKDKQAIREKLTTRSKLQTLSNRILYISNKCLQTN